MSSTQTEDPITITEFPRDIVYANQLNHDLKLLEVPRELVDEILEHGAEVKAVNDVDDAHLCTRDRTYALKINENTHHVVLVQPTQGVQDQVVLSALVPSRFEVADSVAPVDRVRALLHEAPYFGDDDMLMDEDGESGSVGFYTFPDLQALTQISTGELEEEIRHLGACEIKGCIRVLHEEYIKMIVDAVRASVEERQAHLCSFPAAQIEGMVVAKGFDIEGIKGALAMLGSARISEQGEELWELDADKVCIHYARRILLKGSQNLQSFMSAWSRAVPEGFQVAASQLLGQAIINSSEDVIKPFFKSDLPRECWPRVKAIFAEKQSWLLEELQAYLKDAKFPYDWNVDVALLEYCQKYKMRVHDPDMYCIKKSAFIAN